MISTYINLGPGATIAICAWALALVLCAIVVYGGKE